MTTQNSIRCTLALITLWFSDPVIAQHTDTRKTFEAGKHWWAGITSKGDLMPLSDAFTADLKGNTYGNQVQPLLLSDQGDVVWSEKPFQIFYDEGRLSVEAEEGRIEHHQAGETLQEAFRYADRHYFKGDDRLPDADFFKVPQYNTWIELTYNQNQDDILHYARNIIKNGFPPGILMIDDNWQEDYGTWTWHPGRFSDPKAMMNELHDLGFKVMLWVCPFVSPDSATYRELSKKGLFLNMSTGESDKGGLPRDTTATKEPQMVRWWNGISAVLDLSNPEAEQWFKGRLNSLQNDYDVDGFKFDAGDAVYYERGVSFGEVSANEQTALFGKVGLDYPLNEYRAMWKMGGQPLIQRLRDKRHNWEDLKKLVPQMALAGLMGYTYSCPDMIGGGAFTSFLDGAAIDQELIVRSAQSHALMPMMQFSVAPWRVLDQQHLSAVQKAVALREKFADYILETAKESAKTGEPILRPLEYAYPRSGYAQIKNQFLLGESLLVAPVLEKDATELKVSLPEGRWKSFQGKIIKGPKEIKVPVTLHDVPYFEKLDV